MDPFDHQFSNLGAGDLLFFPVKDLLLDFIHDALDLIDADRPLMAGAQDTAFDLLAVIGLSVIVLFDHNHRDGLNLFIGRKPALAAVADPPSADGVVLLDRS